MPTDKGALVWGSNTGQNGWDDFVNITTSQCVSARNISLHNGGLGTRRGGSRAVPITGVTAPILAAFEHIPGQDDTASELFLVDSSGTTKILRCAAGSSFSNLTLPNNVASTPVEVSAVTLNGKLYVAYDGTTNRLKVFDPGYSTTAIRYAGMGTPAAPTAADAGGVGTYAATLRYYRVAFIEVRSGVTIRRSLLGPTLSTTPDGSHLNLTVTKPASISEGETHWELYGSTDDILYYAIAANDVDSAITGAIAVGTTTYADTTAPASYANYSAAPQEGQNTPFPSVKSLGTDGSRLYGLGVWESSAGDSLAPRAGRFYFGPVLDSSDVNDDERINDTTTLSGWIDLARNAGSVDRGVTPKPVNNTIYAFQSNGTFGLVPTDSVVQPYRRVVLSNSIGNVHQKAIVIAQDRNGAPCAFFADPVKGPYIVGGSDGLQWCGKDIFDYWQTVNLDATTITCWGLWYPDHHQVKFFVSTGSANMPNLALVLDVTAQTVDQAGDLRGGWTVFDGDLVAAVAGVLFSNTLNSTRSRVKVPYTGGNSKLLRYNEGVYKDDTTAFSAYVTSGPLDYGHRNTRLIKSFLVADAQSGASIEETTLSTGPLSGNTTDRRTVSLTPIATETVVLRKFEAARVQDAWEIQVQLGDVNGSTPNAPWHLEQWRGLVEHGSEW